MTHARKGGDPRELGLPSRTVIGLAPQGSVPRIEIWLVDLDVDVGPYEWSLISAAERARSANFAFARDRRRFIRAHAAIRSVIGQQMDCAPSRLAFTSDTSGKPRLVGPVQPCFNLSHSGELAAIAVSDGVGEVGVDLEKVRPMPDVKSLAATHFTAHERAALEQAADPDRAFLSIWTRKEAVAKALGVGIGAFDLANLHVGHADSALIAVGNFLVSLESFDPGEGFLGAVAAVGSPRFELRLCAFAPAAGSHAALSPESGASELPRLEGAIHG